jgi:predicted dienelactone hydrolase
MTLSLSILRHVAAMLCAWLVFGASSAVASVGFQVLQISDSAGGQIEIGVWYPAASPPMPRQIGPGMQTVAVDAPVVGAELPLVVISHGNGGFFGGHADTAETLAEAGFVVAALTHTGDNNHDQSRVTDMPNRPRQLSVVIDYMLMRWQDRARIDARRIGAFGFSAGGFTVLAAAGARPDPVVILEHCRRHPDFLDCRLAREHGADLAGWTGWRRDARIKALVVAAPALGFALRESLRTVTIPVQLWQAEFDQVLPAPFYVEPVIEGLPRAPEYHLVPGAEHLDFLMPCTPANVQLASDICASQPGFDRGAFHARFDQDVVRFFLRSLRLRRGT